MIIKDISSSWSNYVNNSLHLTWKYARMFVCRHYLFWKANRFRKTVSLKEQMMAKDKVCQMEAIVFILQYFSQHVQFWQLGIKNHSYNNIHQF